MTTMPEPLALGVAGLGGLVLGAIFFGGLWWTVRRGVSSGRPALWFVVSLVARASMVLGGMHVVAGGQWRRLLACLLGFAVARLGVTRLARWPIPGPPVPAPEAVHAP